MAITIEDYSDQLDTIIPEGNSKLKPNERHGRVRIARFTFTVPAGDLADGSNVAACILPTGARILGGVIKGEALGNSSTVDIGLMGRDLNGYYDAAGSLADDDDAFLAAGSTNAAFNLTFADTIARNYGLELDKECYLVLTVESGDWDAGQDIVGHVEYVVD